VITAKEYYYSVIAPHEKGRSYQGVYQSGVEEAAMKELRELHNSGFFDHFDEKQLSSFEHSPRFSNDGTFEIFMEYLIRNVSSDLKNRLDCTFVARIRDLLPQAWAMHHASVREQTSGELSFVHDGLLRASSRYANLFAEFFSFKSKEERLPSSSPLLAKSLSGLEINARKWIELSSKWSLTGDMLDLGASSSFWDSPPEVKVLTSKFVCDIRMFIMGHELAHHLLGHTGYGCRGGELLAQIPNNTKRWTHVQPYHAKELQADSLSILLSDRILKAQFGSEKDDSGLSNSLLHGSYLTLAVISQIMGDSNKSTPTHPSVQDRLCQCKEIVEWLEQTYVTDFKYSFSEMLIGDFSNFMMKFADDHAALDIGASFASTGDLQNMLSDYHFMRKMGLTSIPDRLLLEYGCKTMKEFMGKLRLLAEARSITID